MTNFIICARHLHRADGISLQGATLRQDLDENQEMYGRKLTNREIVEKEEVAPEAAKELLALLNKYASRIRNR